MIRRQKIRAKPTCDSRISLRKTRRIHSMVRVLLVLRLFESTVGDSPPVRNILAIGTPHVGHLSEALITQKARNLFEPKKFLASRRQKPVVQTYSRLCNSFSHN